MVAQELGYYEIDTANLQLMVNMNVDYDDNGDVKPLTTNWNKTNWWVTSFTPSIQSANVDDIDVHLKVKFMGIGRHSNLMTPFYSQWEERVSNNLGKGLSWSDASDTVYQFYIDY